MRHPWFRKGLIFLFWLFIWQLAAWAIDNSIIFAGPAQMVRALAAQIQEPDFWTTIAASFGRIGLGFGGAFLSGLLLGSAAWRFPAIGEVLEPFMVLIRSVPVASFVILALIWIGSNYLSVLIAFLVVLPMIYVNTRAGLLAADRKLLEMAQVFCLSIPHQIRMIYLPALVPYLAAGCRTALGMSLKSGIAAEVIGLPSSSIGEQLYYSKLYLDTAGLFAWTFVIIVISALFERAALFLLGKLAPATLSPEESRSGGSLYED